MTNNILSTDRFGFVSPCGRYGDYFDGTSFDSVDDAWDYWCVCNPGDWLCYVIRDGVCYPAPYCDHAGDYVVDWSSPTVVDWSALVC